MPQVLQFDGAGTGTMTPWSAAGAVDFTISGVFTYRSGTQIVIGNTAQSNDIVWMAAGGSVRANGAGGSNLVVSGGFVVDEVIVWSLTRTGSNVILDCNGSTAAAANWGSTIAFDFLGNYLAGGIYTGVMSGLLLMTKATDSRSYSFDQPAEAPVSNGTLIPDTVSSNDITLTGFVSGGFIASPDPDIEITNLADMDVVLGDLSGDATVTVSGTLTNVSIAPPAIEARRGPEGSWVTLDASPTNTVFSGTIDLSGIDDLSVRISDDTGVTDTLPELIVAHVIDIRAGQSNEVGAANNLQPFNPCRGNKAYKITDASGVEDMVDPTGTTGSPGGSYLPRISTLYSEAGMIYAAANIAEGGTSITVWLKGTSNYDTIITNMVAQIGSSNISKFTWNLGESDANSGMTQAVYEGHLNDLVDDLFADFGMQTYVTLIVQGSQYSQSNGDAIRAAQQAVIDTNANAFDGGDLSVITLTDPVHMVTNAQITEGGDIIFAAQAPRATLTMPHAFRNDLGVVQGPETDIDVSVCRISDMQQLGTGLVSWGGDGILEFDQIGAVAGDTYAVTVRVSGTRYANGELVAT